MLCEYDCRCVFGGRGTYTRHIFSITRHTNNSPLVIHLLVSRNRNPTQIGFIPKRSFGSYDCKGKRKWVWLSVQLDPRASATSPGISFFPFLGFVFLGLFFIYSQACPMWQQDGCRQVLSSLQQPGNSHTKSEPVSHWPRLGHVTISELILESLIGQTVVTC